MMQYNNTINAHIDVTNACVLEEEEVVVVVVFVIEISFRNVYD